MLGYVVLLHKQPVVHKVPKSQASPASTHLQAGRRGCQATLIGYAYQCAPPVEPGNFLLKNICTYLFDNKDTILTTVLKHQFNRAGGIMLLNFIFCVAARRRLMARFSLCRRPDYNEFTMVYGHCSAEIIRNNLTSETVVLPALRLIGQAVGGWGGRWTRGGWCSNG